MLFRLLDASPSSRPRARAREMRVAQRSAARPACTVSIVTTTTIRSVIRVNGSQATFEEREKAISSTIPWQRRGQFAATTSWGERITGNLRVPGWCCMKQTMDPSYSYSSAAARLKIAPALNRTGSSSSTWAAAGVWRVEDANSSTSSWFGRACSSWRRELSQ